MATKDFIEEKGKFYDDAETLMDALAENWRSAAEGLPLIELPPAPVWPANPDGQE